MSKVVKTTVVRDYDNGGQLVTIDGHDRYCKYHVTCPPEKDGEPHVEGFDEIWLDINGKVIKIHTPNNVDFEYKE